MKQIITFWGLIFILLGSCKKDTINSKFFGLYTEASPVAGRSQLNFISSNLVVKSEPGSNYKDTFNYSFSSGKITLTPTWTNQYSPRQLDFKKIDETSFRIEDLYPRFPESLPGHMIYKK